MGGESLIYPYKAVDIDEERFNDYEETNGMHVAFPNSFILPMKHQNFISILPPSAVGQN